MQTQNKKYNISILGLGYVGAVSSSCLASMGHNIVGVDLEKAKVEAINKGISPIHEPDLPELLEQQVKLGRLRATTDMGEAIASTNISFICVGTPTTEFGEVNLDYVREVVKTVCLHIKEKKQPHITVMRSTVPPGTGQKVVQPIVQRILEHDEQALFHYVSNPEFLREGSAIFDFMNPPETVVGGSDSNAVAEIAGIYDSIDAPLFKTALEVAEMLKYVNNTWHALKVAFTNEVGSICRQLDVDGQDVMDVFCEDKKLNLSAYYMRPGFAFGGSCLPKDVRGLTGLGRRLDVDLPLMNSIIPSNNSHIDRAIDMIIGPGVSCIGILGISFKADTDDIRESPMVTLAKRLRNKGYEVLIYDENVSSSIVGRASSANLINQLDYVTECMCTDLAYVIEKSDVITIGNKHSHFEGVLDKVPHDKKIVDLVRISNEPSHANYHGIGW